MSEIIVPDTCLCTIVRDELMNPAGGIIDFVHSNAPYYEVMVVVDTGSVDETREVLDKLVAQYPNLKIFDVEFKDFSYARNFSLKKAREMGTRYIFIDDADERLTKLDIIELRDFMDANKNMAARLFDCLYIDYDEMKK